MSAQLALGTYRCQAIPEAADRAAASGAQWVDTAPNYAAGRAQTLLAPALAAHPALRVSTKAGYFTAASGADAVDAGVLTGGQAAAGHSLAPDYVRWQTGRNRAELGRQRLDLVLLHNPERAHPGDRVGLHRAIRDAFVVLEEEVAAGHVAGYGIATWSGLEKEAFTVEELLTMASEAAGGQQDHHLAAVQMPVSLVMMTPIVQALNGRGPLWAAAGAGLRVMASAPLHGGELPAIVDQELADLIRPGLTPAQACILATASCPGVTDVLVAASSTPHWTEAADAVAQPLLDTARLREITDVLASPDPDTERRMRDRHAHAARALDAQTEPDGEFWGWAGRTLGAPARTAAGQPAWLRLVSAPEGKAAGKLWDGALDAQHAFGDLDGHRPALLGVHDMGDDGTAYRAELSERVDEPVLSDDPVLQHELQLADTWWEDLAGVLEKVAAVDTGRVAVRRPYMDRAIPQFLGIPVPAVTRWTTAHADLHWANLTASPLRLLDWEGWGQAPEGFDASMLYAYTLLQPDTAARVRDAFPVLGSPVGLAAEATVCAQLLQTVDRGDNLILADGLRDWSDNLRRRLPNL